MSRTRSPVGEELCRIIHAQPGIHFRALERAAKLQSTGQLRHHIDQLQRTGTVVEVSDGGFHRFFIAGDHDRRLRLRMVRFARPLAHRLARTLLLQECTRTEIRRTLGCADSTLGYYLNRMEDAGDIIRRQTPHGVVYALADPHGVREVIEASLRASARAPAKPVKAETPANAETNNEESTPAKSDGSYEPLSWVSN